MQEAEVEAATPHSAVGATPFTINGETPHAKKFDDDDSGDESMGSGDADDAPGAMDEIDEEEKVKQVKIQGIKEDIADLEKQIGSVQEQYAGVGNPILKKRLEGNLRKLNAELQLKKSSLGEGEENEND